MLFHCDFDFFDWMTEQSMLLWADRIEEDLQSALLRRKCEQRTLSRHVTWRLLASSAIEWQRRLAFHARQSAGLGLQVSRWSSEHFPPHRMGRRSPNLPWPPPSSDLAPCDSFVYMGFIKSRVYLWRPTNAPDLKERTWEAFEDVIAEVRQNIFYEYPEDLLEKGLKTMMDTGKSNMLGNWLIFILKFCE